mmetsp:Transcript_23539/g.49325  ORF Transcript_23539/g.49325 Transcript_23539/m.49325 type:complete len:242 (-) Transcript_23539:478-1203(-)
MPTLALPFSDTFSHVLTEPNAARPVLCMNHRYSALSQTIKLSHAHAVFFNTSHARIGAIHSGSSFACTPFCTLACMLSRSHALHHDTRVHGHIHVHAYKHALAHAQIHTSIHARTNASRLSRTHVCMREGTHAQQNCASAQERIFRARTHTSYHPSICAGIRTRMHSRTSVRVCACVRVRVCARAHAHAPACALWRRWYTPLIFMALKTLVWLVPTLERLRLSGQASSCTELLDGVCRPLD